MEIVDLNLQTLDEISDRTGIDKDLLLNSYLESSLRGNRVAYVFTRS